MTYLDFGVARCSLTVVVAEQRECREAAVERQDKAAPFNLAHFPAADVVADLHAIDFVVARANDGACAFVVHNNSKQLHIGRLWHDRDRCRLG